MRNLVHALILMLAAGVFVAAQTNNDSTCPAISVTGPAELLKPNASAIYTVTIESEGKYPNLGFFWSISTGEIITGQGTKTLTVRQPDASLTVNVDITGLPQGCLNLASEFSCGLRPQEADKLLEFSGTFSQIGQIDFEYISKVVQNDPTAQLYILNKYKDDISKANVKKKEETVRSYLMKAGIEADRITFISGREKVDLIEFYLVPAGATPPALEQK